MKPGRSSSLTIAEIVGAYATGDQGRDAAKAVAPKLRLKLMKKSTLDEDVHNYHRIQLKKSIPLSLPDHVSAIGTGEDEEC